MRSKKLQVTDDILLDALLKPEEELSIETIKNNSNDIYQEDILFFLTAFGIKPGNFYTSWRLLDVLLRKWTKLDYTNKNTYNYFKRVLPVHIDGRVRGFLINQSTFKVEKEVRDHVNKKFKKKSVNINKSIGVIKRRNYIKKFLNELEIVPGDQIVELEFIYYLFTKWASKAQVTVFKYADFYHYIRYFIYVADTKKYGYCVKVNLELLKKHYGQEDILEAAKFYEEKENKKK